MPSARSIQAVIAFTIVSAIVCSCGATTTRAAGSTIVLGQADAGRTVQVRVGDTVRVTLMDEHPVPGSALVWNVTSLDPSVLQPGLVAHSPRVPTGPAGGPDTYSADFHVIAAGQAVLDAHGSTSCEAMPKQNCPDRDFKITVVATR